MTDNHEPQAYPLNIRGDLSSPPNRGLWLIKWILAIPHFIVLFFLSIVGIRANYNRLLRNPVHRQVSQGHIQLQCWGVMRWWWRVSFYAGILGTDRYPPFSLSSDDDYPADLSVEYPEQPLAYQSAVQVVAAGNPALPNRILLRGHAGRAFYLCRHRSAVHRAISR